MTSGPDNSEPSATGENSVEPPDVGHSTRDPETDETEPASRANESGAALTLSQELEKVPEFESAPDPVAAGNQGISTLTPEPPLEPYNPQKKLDEVRARLAFRLLWVLIGVIAGGFLLLLTLRWTGIAQITDIRPTFLIVFSNIVTLVSAATGFYFGQQSTGGGSNRGGP
jgi:hypothetical protein